MRIWSSSTSGRLAKTAFARECAWVERIEAALPCGAAGSRVEFLMGELDSERRAA
jgi:hypothetical protein